MSNPIIIEPTVYNDERGFFYESYLQKEVTKNITDFSILQENISFSKRGVVRGLHYQLKMPQAKLCRVSKGAVIDVAVDIRNGSPTFGKYIKVLLTEENKKQLFVPRGFAHGFMAVSEEAEFVYKCDNYYSGAEDQLGVLWSDPDLKIDWSLEKNKDYSFPNEFLLSSKDKILPCLKDIPSELLPSYEG